MKSPTNTTNSTLANQTANYNNNKDCVQKSYTYLKSWFIVIGSFILLLNGKFSLT